MAKKGKYAKFAGWENEGFCLEDEALEVLLDCKDYRDVAKTALRVYSAMLPPEAGEAEEDSACHELFKAIAAAAHIAACGKIDAVLGGGVDSYDAIEFHESGQADKALAALTPKT
jgi:hypothetical protein